MMEPASTSGRRATPFSALRAFAAPKKIRPAEEHCELCSVGLGPDHRHLLESATRKIICACDPCALRFENVIGKLKLIPRDIWSLPGFRMDDATWESLALPIGLAFVFYDSKNAREMAYYPSPAGATESLLPLAAWQALVEANPGLSGMEPDVEVFLVNRVGERRDYYRIPIDVCFELVGIIRIHWRGFTGGEEVWREVDGYFKKLEERARPARQLHPPRQDFRPAPGQPHSDANPEAARA